jgi:outer membrane receptor for ferrienterochelin and colicin
MKKISFLILSSLQYFVVAQNIDSLSIKKDSVFAAVKDSVIKVIPIPEIGSIEPFGDSSNIISRREITFREFRSLYDIIGSQPGIFMRDLASPGQQNQIISAGLDDKHIAIMVDGIPYNDYYTGSFNLWNIPVDAVERIEFISGTNAMFYDGKSAGGTINIVTKNFNNNRAFTHLRYSQGVSGYTHTDAMFAQNIANGLNLSFALGHYGFGSNKGNQKYRGRFVNSNNDAWNVRSKLRYNLTDWFNLSFSYFYNKTWTGLHGGVDLYTTTSVYDGLEASVENFETYEKLYSNSYNLTAAFYPSADSSSLATISVYSLDRLREYRNEENRNLSTTSGLSQVTDGIFQKRDFSSTTKGVKLNLVSQYSDIRVVSYADFARIKSQDIITAGVKSELFRSSFFVVSPFATVKDFRDRFTLNGGVEGKLKIFSSFEAFGGIAQNIINDKTTSVTSSSAFSNLTILYTTQKLDETFSLMEAGVKFSLPSLFSFKASYKRTIQKNPIVIDTVSAISSAFNYNYFYPGQYTFDAITASAHFMWNDFHLEGTANYLKQPTVIRNNTALTLYPEITANGSVYYEGLLANGNLDIKFGFRGNFYSKQTGMKPYDEFGVWLPTDLVTFGPSGTVDFFAVGKIGDAYVHLIWENLSGTQYLLAPVYPMYERNIRFGVSWEFLD